MKIETAKLWIWANGELVKVKLRRGDKVSWYQAFEHEEGWHSDFEQLHFDGDFVWRESVSDGRDCDGRHTSTISLRCHVMKLHAREFEGLRLPVWSLLDQHEYDQFAQLMNY